jgi:hypothetical protein
LEAFGEDEARSQAQLRKNRNDQSVLADLVPTKMGQAAVAERRDRMRDYLTSKGFTNRGIRDLEIALIRGASDAKQCLITSKAHWSSATFS